MNDSQTPRQTLSGGRQTTETSVSTGLSLFVKGSSWAASLQPKTLDRLLAATTVRKLMPGEPLCLQGEPPRQWFGLMQGLLRQDVFGRDGERVSLSAWRLGNWFGEGALLLGEPRKYEISAMRASQVACLGAAAFAQAVAEDPEFNRSVLQMLSARMHFYMELYTVQRGFDPEHLIARSLVTLVGHSPHGLHLNLDITQDELAQLAGVSRQRAHQALHALQERGLLEISYGAIKLLDVERLIRPD